MNWVIFTVLAAFFQNLRTSLQKRLNKNLSLVASAYVRFAFALPFAFIIFFIKNIINANGNAKANLTYADATNDRFLFNLFCNDVLKF